MKNVQAATYNIICLFEEINRYFELQMLPYLEMYVLYYIRCGYKLDDYWEGGHKTHNNTIYNTFSCLFYNIRVQLKGKGYVTNFY